MAQSDRPARAAERPSTRAVARIRSGMLRGLSGARSTTQG